MKKALEAPEERTKPKGEGSRPLLFLLGSSNPSGLHFLVPAASGKLWVSQGKPSTEETEEI